MIKPENKKINRNRIKFGLKPRLVIAIQLLILLPMLISCVIVYVQNSNNNTQQWTTNLESVGKQKIDTLNSWVEERKDNLHSYSQFPEIRLGLASMDSNR
jgi:predicted PurR-regulated permease PerM